MIDSKRKDLLNHHFYHLKELISLKSKYDCCGCTACASICSKKSIIMKPDEEGFLYPSVDVSTCVDCGLCEKVCPFIARNTCNNKDLPISIYAVYHKDKTICRTSSSGGVFAALVDYCLQHGGIAYGAEYDENFIVVHRGEETEEGTIKFRGSKYVQSDLRGVYSEIRKHLKTDRKVLFSGTPCQVEGLKCFLLKPYENLLTIDIICHGVPSPKMFEDYVKYIKKNSFFKLTGINMKDKTFGWGFQDLRLYFGKNRSLFNTTLSKLWNKIYYSHLAMRPSCYHCHFTNFYRPGDITIGDFWGIENAHPDFVNKDGVSLCMINSEKGVDVWTHIKSRLNYIESDASKCIQPNLQHPVCEPEGKKEFATLYQQKGFGYITKHFFEIKRSMVFKENILFVLKLILGKNL